MSKSIKAAPSFILENSASNCAVLAIVFDRFFRPTTPRSVVCKSFEALCKADAAFSPAPASLISCLALCAEDLSETVSDRISPAAIASFTSPRIDSEYCWDSSTVLARSGTRPTSVRSGTCTSSRLGSMPCRFAPYLWTSWS